MTSKKPLILDPNNLKTPPHYMLAVDPGESTGWAIFEDGILIQWGIERGVNAFDDWLHECQNGFFEKVVYEDYRLFGHKAKQQIGSRFEAVQVIGLLQSWARRQGIEIDLSKDRQPSGILPEGLAFSGWVMPGDHSKSHHVAAIAHGTYWLVKNGMIMPVGG